MRETLRANSAVCEPQWSGSKCLSLADTLTNSHSKRRIGDIFANFISCNWPAGLMCSVCVSVCGSGIWFQPHGAG